jgi:hypothetical protein
MGLRTIDKYIKWNEQLKMFEPVMWRRDVLPSWITFLDGTVVPTTIPAAPSNGILQTMNQPYTSLEGMDKGLGTPFEIRSLMASGDPTDLPDPWAAMNYTVRIKEVGESREFMNAPIHVKCMFGDGQRPFMLREPFMFLSEHNLSFQLTKVAGGAVTTSLFGAGAQYFPWSPGLVQNKVKPDMTGLLRKWVNRRRYVTPFFNTTDNPVVLPGTYGASVNANIKFGDDGQFEAFGHTVVSTGNFGLIINETKTKQTLMNNIISQVNGIGDARFPTIYPQPYLIPAGFRLNMQFFNLTAAPNTIYFCFFGRRIFAPISQVQEVIRDSAVPTPADTPTQMVPAPL